MLTYIGNPLRDRRTLGRLLLAGLGVIMLGHGPALAQAGSTYPDKPIKLVVPLPPGGNMDAMTRIIAERLSTSVGQPVIVENKPGATGAIGAAAVAQAKPDGTTVLFAISSIVQAVVLQKNPPYKLSELQPVVQLAQLPIGFGVATSMSVTTLAEFVKLARERPKTAYASYGNGSAAHIIGETLAAAAKLDLLHVPYKGEAPAFNDLLGGHVASVFASVGGINQHTGKIRLLAVTGSRRLSRFPDAPTFDEAGFPLNGLTGWAGVFVPAGTPQPIVDKLAAEIARILAMPDVQAKILDYGFEPAGRSAEPFAAFVDAQAKQWAAATKVAKIEPE